MNRQNHNPVFIAILLAAIMGIGTVAGAEEPAPQAVSKTVNINTATVAEFEQLPGIGPSKAEAIVAYRTKRPFKKIEDIVRVKGIGRKTFKKLRPYLTMGNSKK